MNIFKRSIFLFLIFFLILPIYLSGQINSKNLSVEIEKLLEDNFFESSIIALDIYDLDKDSSLYRKNEKLLLHPASNMKIITTSAALLYLGTEYKFETSLYHTGIIMDSVCYGDLYVKGGLDPDFTSSDLDSLVSNLKLYGINEIRGNIYGDVSSLDSLFWGSGWMWDDDPSAGFPYMTPLIINDVAVKIAYSPGSIGKPVIFETIPKSEFFDITNTAVTSREDTSNFEITRNWINRGNKITISGDLSYREKPDTSILNLVDPEYYFLFLLQEQIVRKNIRLYGKIDTLTVPEFAHHIYTFKRSFKDIIVNLNKKSDNLSAEMTLRAMSLKYFGKPASAEQGIRLLDSMITTIGLDPKNYSFADGSGVSRYNLVSAELILEILKYFYSSSPENFNILYNSFPIAGIDGTLENRMKRTAAENNVHAKTGTLSGVSALSGYLTNSINHKIAFSIIIQNYLNSARTARYFQDKICEILCKVKY